MTRQEFIERFGCDFRVVRDLGDVGDDLILTQDMGMEEPFYEVLEGKLYTVYLFRDYSNGHPMGAWLIREFNIFGRGDLCVAFNRQDMEGWVQSYCGEDPTYEEQEIVVVRNYKFKITKVSFIQGWAGCYILCYTPVEKK